MLEALLEAAKQPATLETPAPSAIVKNYGDNAIEYQLFAWTNSGDFWDTKCQIMQDVKRVFDQKGIEMTYPHINVHLEK